MPKKNTENNTSALKAVDFFCGAGGVTCGFLKAGINVLGGIDIDETCKETYEKNNNSKFIHSDISKYKPEQLQKDLNITPNDDNLIFIGCSPCQYYTIINTSKEKSAKSRLLLEDFKKFVDYFRPGFIFIENVPGLESKKESPLQTFKQYLYETGYFIDDKIINALDYEVPQNRKRYVLLASRITNVIAIPKLKCGKGMTVRNFISEEKGFDRIPAGHKDLTDFQHSCAGLQAINIARLRSTPPDGGTRLAWKDDPELQLPCYVGKDDLFYDVYGRMYWDQPSPTITTKFYSTSNGRFAHPEQNRAISIREGAVLQSFPLDYKFYSNSIEKAARMIGNAVPPNMARKIGQEIIKARKNASIQSQSKSS
ncbi:DNA cytosine methyltransferase [Cesiribacter sp. SM1]|uniref:DNA cytosine methyltransferase n=1 Tax=Cesiribacter sp. SM1 TaxID=2861196 RepID=UPI001CD572E4|nr:DNA cytosine methyltransferase [Cesiribacter sp. SM1]